ncbi:hypothetical protein ACW9KT_19465 [Hymenobacter sp. HD11105]
MTFDPFLHEIAVTIPRFRMRKSADAPLPMNQPYLISLALDESGTNNPLSALTFNAHRFPNVRQWSWVEFGGQGRLIYGPGNPGRFVSYSVLFMEDDQNLRDIGGTVEELLSSEEAKGILQLLRGVNPTIAVATTVLSALTGLLAGNMKRNKDDELMRVEGTLLRDMTPPYNIGDTFASTNKYLEVPVKVVPLLSAPVGHELAMFSTIPQRLELAEILA